jgi:hypothetical protein
MVLFSVIFLSLHTFVLGANPVGKIIELLQDMKAKTEADIAEEKATMEEFMQYCDDEATAKGRAINEAKNLIGDLTATSEESEAIAGASSTAIAEMGSLVAQKESDLEEATAVRKAQNADFVIVEKDLLKSIDQLDRAAAEIQRGKSFVQLSKKDAMHLESSLSAVVKSARAANIHNKGQKPQSDDDDDHSLSLLQGKDGLGDFSAKGVGVLEIIKQTKNNAKAQLESARKGEMEAAHAYAMVKLALENAISSANEKVAAAKEKKYTSEQVQSKAQGELVETKKTKMNDEVILSSLKADCQEQAVAWEHTVTDAQAEIAAIGKAIDILGAVTASSFIQSSSDTSFLQLSSLAKFQMKARDVLEDSDRDDDVDEEENERRHHVAKSLMALGRKYHSHAFMQLAGRVRSDPFGKVRSMIEEMIAKLLAEAADEATQKAFCDTEMGKTKKDEKTKVTKLDQVTGRLDKATSDRAALEMQIKHLQGAILDIDKGQHEATKIRHEEHEQYLKASKDFQLSEEACASAAATLKAYYDQAKTAAASLLQIRSQSHMRMKTRTKSQVEFGSSQSETGAQVVDFLELAEEDFAKLLAEVEDGEEVAEKAYQKMSTENKVSKASKMAEAKAKTSEIKSLTSTIHDWSEDSENVGHELDAVQAYADKLKPMCTTKTMSYEEKVAARKAEIDGLKEALSILEGKDIAFLQSGKGHLRGP